MGSMDVSEAVRTRRSVRAFLDQPVPMDAIREVLRLAARAPSGGNLQPWWIHVVAGEAMTRLKQTMATRVTSRFPDPPEYDVYPANLWEPYRSRRYDLGEAMYEVLGITRDDKVGRLRRFAQNYEFFGAPVGLFCFVDRKLGAPQWSDLGMYLQTVMLLLRERGLDSCAQEAWSTYHQTVGEFVKSPPHLMLFCGMAIGYADRSASVNQFAVERAPLEEFATFHET
jgi:nitroreductase